MEFIYDNIDDLYVMLAKAVLTEGNKIVIRKKEVTELLSVSITLTDASKDNFLRNTDRKLSMRYAFGELLWYLSGSKSLSFISHYAKSYSNFSDDNNTLNGAYGPRIMPFIKSIIDLLREDPSTRRAVINIYNNNDIGNPSNDIPCTVSLQFFIRKDKLLLQTYMRSNDLYLGVPYDIFSFTFLQKYIASKLNIDVGSYYHYVSNLHIYKQHYDFFSNITNRLNNSIEYELPSLENVIQNLDSILILEEKLRTGENLTPKKFECFPESKKIINILKGKN